MFGNQSMGVVLGAVFGAIMGYLFASDKVVDEQRIASIIRAELRAVGTEQAAPRLHAVSQEKGWSPQTTESVDSVGLGGVGTQARLDELKAGQEALIAAIRDIEQRLGQQPGVEQSAEAGYEVENARYEAEAFLGDAIASGRWSSADAQRYYGLLQKLPSAERIAGLKKLSVAINNGRIHPEPPFAR